MPPLSDFAKAMRLTDIDQLHKAVLQFSANCFEVKKLCATVLLAALTLIVTFTNKQLDYAVFVGALLTIAFFWVLDAQSYYYQDKIRARMKDIAQELAQNAGDAVLVDGVGMPMPAGRENLTQRKRLRIAFFNASMYYYLILVIIAVVLFVAFECGLIHAYPGAS
jgi:hypothetical protein